VTDQTPGPKDPCGFSDNVIVSLQKPKPMKGDNHESDEEVPAGDHQEGAERPA
jgi:hypothetical protein